jgi:proteasome accessory factor B
MPAPDAAERLLNLLIALSHARGRMTRAEIRATVAGYDPPNDHDDAETARKRTAAFERMFERDKEDLRRVGVPLRTVTDAAHGDDIGYVIHLDDAAMPPISLTPVERAVLAVAAEYWQSASLGTNARRALLKVSSGMERIEDVPVHLTAHSREGADAAPLLAQAIVDRQAVRFTYTSHASGRAERTVEPHRLLVKGGALYLVGLDRDRGEPRTYRLSRIEGAVTVVGERGAFERIRDEEDAPLDDAVPTLRARIGLRAESGHALRRRGTFVETRGGWDVFDVPYSDTDALREEILGLAGAACVCEPSSLADAVSAYATAAREVARG